MITLNRAIVIASETHAGQLDKAGQPYILHPLRVMLAVPEHCRIVAVLHDVLEDSPHWTAERLRRQEIPDHMIHSLKKLTRTKGAPYENYVAVCAGDPVARIVKMADLRDNMDRTRFPHGYVWTLEDMARMEKYQLALEYLENRG